MEKREGMQGLHGTGEDTAMTGYYGITEKQAEDLAIDREENRMLLEEIGMASQTCGKGSDA